MEAGIINPWLDKFIEFAKDWGECGKSYWMFILIFKKYAAVFLRDILRAASPSTKLDYDTTFAFDEETEYTACGPFCSL